MDAFRLAKPEADSLLSASIQLMIDYGIWGKSRMSTLICIHNEVAIRLIN